MGGRLRRQGWSKRPKSRAAPSTGSLRSDTVPAKTESAHRTATIRDEPPRGTRIGRSWSTVTARSTAGLACFGAVATIFQLLGLVGAHWVALAGLAAGGAVLWSAGTGHRAVAGRIGAVALLVMPLSLGFMMAGLRTSDEQHMDGDYNIAVAEFAQLDGTRVSRATEGRLFATSVYDRLVAATGPLQLEGFHVVINSPDASGRLSGSTVGDFGNSALAQAQTLNADLMITGLISRSVDASTVTPQFFLSSTRIPDAEELADAHRFGAPISVPGDMVTNPLVRKELRERLIARTNALGEFVIGLSYYGVGRYDAALDHFTAAETNSDWARSDGKEVLYLFLGNTVGRLGDLANAQVYYSQAVEINSSYDRARLGLAEVQFQQSRGTCESGSVNAVGLGQARKTYNDVLATSNTDDLYAAVRLKALFGDGRTLVCLSQAMVEDHWIEAEGTLNLISREFQQGNHSIRTLAAESEALLGIIALPSFPHARTDAAYSLASAHFQRAAEWASSPDRRALFYSLSGYARWRLQEFDEAESAYRLAVGFASPGPLQDRYGDSLRAIQQHQAPPTPSLPIS